MSQNPEQFELREAPGGGADSRLDDDTRALFERGVSLIGEDDPDTALDCLRQAHDRHPDHARLRSYLGLALARSEHADFEQARVLCESAAKQEFFNPEHYRNLALVYLRFGRRSEALRYLRRGQMIDPGDESILDLMASLGRRRLPILPFLPRRHPINRALGNARSRVMAVFSRP
jgi:tetratricopeptide (TPR) repeat protein